MKRKVKRQKTIEELMESGTEIDEALREGVRAALLKHQRAGNPVYGMYEGKARWVTPDEIAKILNEMDQPKTPKRRRAASV